MEADLVQSETKSGVDFEGATVPATLDIEDLPRYVAQTLAVGTPWSRYYDADYDGDKFPGGFGDTFAYRVDYWVLRMRSRQLFRDNLYAKGLIRRLLTNEISTGLTPEVQPDEKLLGRGEGDLADWSEELETRFAAWARSARVCDWYGQANFGSLQREARREALIGGDVLVVLRYNKRLECPQVQLIPADQVQTPLAVNQRVSRNRKIMHGVEMDNKGRHVAYWINQADGRGSKRLPAYGEKSRRRIAWLVYGTDRMIDEVRGEPLLSVVLQSLREIDRYRDSIQRKAVVNSILAMFIKRDQVKTPSNMFTGGAVKRVDTFESADGRPARKYNEAQHVPGLVLEELEVGEEPQAFQGQGTIDGLGDFERAVISGIAWALEIPPEVLLLSFNANYSASQASINEFKMYLNRIWGEFGQAFCSPVYRDWMLSEVLAGRIRAPGFLNVWRNRLVQYVEYAAWTGVEWLGSIKPSTDMLKAVKGSKMLIEEGMSTRAREARILTGTKFSRNVRELARENEAMAKANEPLVEAGLIGKAPASEGSDAPDDRTENEQ